METIHNNNQLVYWDTESQRLSYCSDFLRAAEDNSWIDMFLLAEKKIGNNVQSNILEIGGGSQYLSRYIALNRSCQVFCTDISQKRILDFNLHYNSEIRNLRTIGGVDARNLPFCDGTFDYIVGDAVLHHIESLREALFEINRCLKKDGLAIFIREPVVGYDVFLKRKVKKILGIFTDKYSIAHEKSLFENRFEFEKTLLQWKEEFFRGGFESKMVRGWYYKEQRPLYKLIPKGLKGLSTGFVCLILQKSVDLSRKNKKISVI